MNRIHSGFRAEPQQESEWDMNARVNTQMDVSATVVGLRHSETDGRVRISVFEAGFSSSDS